MLQDAQNAPASSEQSRLREKARLVRVWYNLDRRFVKQLCKALWDTLSFTAVVIWIDGISLGRKKIACQSYPQVGVVNISPVKATAVCMIACLCFKLANTISQSSVSNFKVASG